MSASEGGGGAELGEGAVFLRVLFVVAGSPGVVGEAVEVDGSDTGPEV